MIFSQILFHIIHFKHLLFLLKYFRITITLSLDFFFETGFHNVYSSGTDPELSLISPPHPPQCWDYKHTLLFCLEIGFVQTGPHHVVH